jgi:phage shock protein PspC (stress-responsive transcriptional regulator)
MDLVPAFVDVDFVEHVVVVVIVAGVAAYVGMLMAFPASNNSNNFQFLQSWLL